jgi:hypothetical protein
MVHQGTAKHSAPARSVPGDERLGTCRSSPRSAGFSIAAGGVIEF